MKLHFLATAILLLGLLAPTATASISAAGSGSVLTQCTVRELAAISGVITSSTIEACFTSPEVARSTTSAKAMTWNVEGPDVPTGGTATFTATTVSAVGCTVSAWVTQSNILAAGTGATSYATVTMTSDECHGFTQMVITAAAVPVTLATFVFGFNIYDNGLQIESWPSVNIASWPSVNIASWPDLNTFVELDDNDDKQVLSFGAYRFYFPPSRVEVPYSTGSFSYQTNVEVTSTDSAAYKYCQGATCSTTPSIQVMDGTCTSTGIYNQNGVVGGPLTGGLYRHRSSTWTVDFNAEMCRVTWGVSIITNGGAGTAIFSGNVVTEFVRVEHPNMESWPAVAGGLTVTDDANGWATHQDPLSGNVTIKLADDQVHDGQLTVASDILVNTNSTINGNLTFPDQLGLYSVQDHDGLDSGSFFWVILWMVALALSLRKGKLMTATGCTLAMLLLVIPGPDFIQWVAIFVVLASLWLEAIAGGKIYARFFGGAWDETSGRRGTEP